MGLEQPKLSHQFYAAGQRTWNPALPDSQSSARPRPPSTFSSFARCCAPRNSRVRHGVGDLVHVHHRPEASQTARKHRVLLARASPAQSAEGPSRPATPPRSDRPGSIPPPKGSSESTSCRYWTSLLDKASTNSSTPPKSHAPIVFARLKWFSDRRLRSSRNVFRCSSVSSSSIHGQDLGSMAGSGQADSTCGCSTMGKRAFSNFRCLFVAAIDPCL